MLDIYPEYSFMTTKREFNTWSSKTSGELNGNEENISQKVINSFFREECTHLKIESYVEGNSLPKIIQEGFKRLNYDFEMSSGEVKYAGDIKRSLEEKELDKLNELIYAVLETHSRWKSYDYNKSSFKRPVFKAFKKALKELEEYGDKNLFNIEKKLMYERRLKNRDAFGEKFLEDVMYGREEDYFGKFND